MLELVSAKTIFGGIGIMKWVLLFLWVFIILLLIFLIIRHYKMMKAIDRVLQEIEKRYSKNE